MPHMIISKVTTRASFGLYSRTITLHNQIKNFNNQIKNYTNSNNQIELTRKKSGGGGSPLYPECHVKPPQDYDPLKYRNWVDLNPNQIDKSKRISIMSYNLLSQHYVWKQVFGYLKQDYLNWPDYRFPLIKQTIEYFKCDIMCFQELEESVYQRHFKDGFPDENYTSIFVKKLNPNYWGTKPLDQMDGVGVLVNKQRFDIVNHHEINFSQFVSNHPDRFSITKDVYDRVLPRNTVALIVQLYDKLNDKMVYVTNTHLYWSPKFTDVKLFQAKLLLSILNEIINEDGYKSPCIIMCGDFNSTPESIVFKLLNNPLIKIDQFQELLKFNYGSRINNEIMIDNQVKNPFQLSPVYEALLRRTAHHDRLLDFTSYTRALTAVLDHIWYSNNNLNVYRVLGEVNSRYVLNYLVKGFPNEQFPSDHIPLVAEVSYL